MIWALFEIIIPLLLTFILGLIMGWLLWRWRRRRITASDWNTHAEAANVAAENLESFRVKHDDLVRDNSQLSVTMKKMSGDLDGRKIELDNTVAKSVELEKSLNAANEKLAAADKFQLRASELETELNSATMKLGDFDKTQSEVVSLRGQLADANNKASELEKTTAKVGQLEAQCESYRTRIAALEAELKEASDKASGSEQHLARIQDLERQLEACKKRSTQLEQAQQNASVHPASPQPVTTAQQQPASPARATGNWRDSGTWQKGITKLGTPGSDHQDDLKVIKGIGPEMEKLLNSFEIQSWEQLAALTDEEVQKVDAALTDFPGRIERDEWVLQAQEIMDNGHVVPDKKPKKLEKQAAVKSADSGDWRSGTTTHFGTPGSSHRDDLKEINGIGPVLEKTLNDFGIQSWEQLAELRADEVDKIDQAIAFPGRIEREEWIEQAKTLVERFPDRSQRPYRKPL